MFETIKNKLDESNKENSPKNMSFDFKLMFVYHIAMMVLFGARPIDNAYDQIIFAIALGVILIVASGFHKLKHNWSWPGLDIMNIPGVIFSLLFFYVFFGFTAYAMNPDIPEPEIQLDNLPAIAKEAWPIIMQAISIPTFTPWYLAGFGIVAFNILSSLNLANQKKSEFESQCVNSMERK